MIEAWPDTRDDPIARACGRLPILDQLEDRELAEIDTSEWCVPSAEDGRRLAQAGDRLGVYLMAYRVRQEAEVGRGLCNRIVPARLDTSALDEILEIETALPDVVIVAYERPLRRRQCRRLPPFALARCAIENERPERESSRIAIITLQAG